MTDQIDPKPVNSKFNDEQWEAINYTGKNILVAASAGSGKTTVLIERILTHIQNDYAGINELLVVTFTEAAANEMKLRMSRRLKDSVNETTDPQKQQMLLQQLRQLPMAHIRTLHSFCLQVIQQFFYLKDYNPSFQLLTDSTQQLLILEQVWEDLIEEIMQDSPDTTDKVSRNSYLELLNAYANGRNDEGLFNIVLDLYQFAMSQPEPMQWLKDVDTIYQHFDQFEQSDLYNETLTRQIKDAVISASKLLNEALGLLMSMNNETIERYELVLNQDLNQVKSLYSLLQKDDLKAIIDFCSLLSFTTWPNNSKKFEDYEVIPELKNLRDKAKNIITEDVQKLFNYNYEATQKIEATVQPYVKALGNLTILFINKLNRHKERLNVIDYNDLEHMTLNLLTNYDQNTQKRTPSIAAEYYQDLFKEVLVDEYQDINEIQASILSWLSHDNIPEKEGKGNLFMVGDIKQSIYGFRMSEPSLFLHKYITYQKSEEGKLINLNKNYRSRDEVLQFTNFIFERIMDVQVGEMNYKEQEQLVTGNHSFVPQAPDSSFNIQLLLNESEELESNNSPEQSEDNLIIDSSLEAEAHIIAQDIHHRIQSQEMIYDKDTEKTRPLEYKDIVILSSTRKPFLALQNIFEQYNIPLIAQKVENYFQRQEVQIMLALLKIIDNPLQDIPYAAILRSYFVGLDDQELSEIRIYQPNGTYYTAALAFMNDSTIEDSQLIKIQKRLQQFMKQLQHWRHLSKTESLVELIWTIYQESYYLDYVGGLSNGDQRQANLHALYERAEEFSNSGFKGITGFIHYIEQVMRQDNDLAEPVIMYEDQNFVRVMTVHASKGLEFPYVFLINTNKRFNMQDTRKPYVASKRYGLSSDLYLSREHLRYRSLIKEAMKIEKENQLKAEEMRKLYVAITRCEQQLIIVGSVKNQDAWLSEIEEVRQLTDTKELLANTQKRHKASSWLAWIQQAIAVSQSSHSSYSHFKEEQIDIEFINSNELNLSNVMMDSQYKQMGADKWLDMARQQLATHPLDEKDSSIQTLKRLMNHQYENRLATNTSSYQSVSELKRLYEEPRIEKISYYQDRRTLPNNQERTENISGKVTDSVQAIRYTEDTFEEPQFLSQKAYSATEIGTFTHYVLQQLDFEAFKATDDVSELINEQIASLIEKSNISEQEAQTVSVNQIKHFIESRVGQLLIQHANSLQRERAFSLLLPAKDIFRTQLQEEEIRQLDNDQLLIHGVIDSFFETEEGLIILDYKTDRFRAYASQTREQQIQIIINKYKFQLSLYKHALELSQQASIDKAFIVLLDFNEIVEVNDLYQF